MKYTGTLEAINSKRDIYGNCYWALRYTDHKTGKQICGTVSGGLSNITGIARHWNVSDGWDRSLIMRETELPIREFNRITKHWEYAGCIPEKLSQFIKERLQ